MRSRDQRLPVAVEGPSTEHCHPAECRGDLSRPRQLVTGVSQPAPQASAMRRELSHVLSSLTLQDKNHWISGELVISH